MADLTLWKWEQYAPDMGENRKLKSPFFLKIRSGLTKLEFQALVEMKADTPEKWAEALKGTVELGDEPLVVNGTKINSLEEYIALGWTQRNNALIRELIKAVLWHNSVDGAKANFSERSSGGRAFTAFGTEPSQMAAENSVDGTETNH